jgi:hypothetical protein
VGAIVNRAARRRPVRVIGDCKPETVCLHCHQCRDVKHVVDATVVAGRCTQAAPRCGSKISDRAGAADAVGTLEGHWVLASSHNAAGKESSQ